MSRSRLALAVERNKLQPPVARFPNVQRPAPKQEMNIDQFVPALLKAGAKVGYMLQFSAEGKVVRLVSHVGPLAIPLDFPADKARLFAAQIIEACDKAEAVEPEPEIELSAGLIELLEEVIRNTTPAEAVADSPSE